ncbi:cobyrinate a,c-diamide synthase [Dyadobacter tibetensis]|uniref:cobyrinate a,c-diamide synthase n=1 Tax=Dyadobacter tibetensis TaxID=1211851 RepID=UPI000470E674|nr:cobyrinate a,c-diamide synthase [Dyadobacter tibetensis]
MTKAHFLISAPSSNSGKTTLTLGILRALRLKGLAVQPFKCGPDYIDPLHHEAACGRQSVNLDTFMASQDHVQQVYQRLAKSAAVSVTEGVMGLFDGAVKMEGSSASIAELLGLPVILVVDARSMAYSAAPLLYGYNNFYKGIKVAGVIFNFVNTPSHYSFLEDACKDVGVEALGYLPKTPAFAIPSRHLGLQLPEERDFDKGLDLLAEQICQTIDLDRLLEITSLKLSDESDALDATCIHTTKDADLNSPVNLRIAVARDAAFSFTYQQNIEALSRLGTIYWFSPLTDDRLPEVDFLYLPGGYPELYAKELSENRSMTQSVFDYCDGGGVVWAECGGMMYLGQSLVDQGGGLFPMSRVFNFSTSMERAKLSLGYRKLVMEDMQIRGHEFHYSNLIEDMEEASNAMLDLQVFTARDREVSTSLYQHKNTYASYLHLYWGENDDFLKYLISRSSSTQVARNSKTITTG